MAQQLNLTEHDKEELERQHATAIECERHAREQRRIESLNAPVYSEMDLVAAKRDLAVKVLAIIEREEVSRFGKGATGISSAVRDFFTESGVEVETKTP